MKIGHGEQLSPLPIRLSIGKIRKPRLIDIASITFDQFSFYEVFLKLTPESYYGNIKGEKGKEYWGSLSDEQKANIDMFDIITQDKSLCNLYLDIFNFFFVEDVIYKEDVFVVLKRGDEPTAELDGSAVQGIIFWKNFKEILEIIQQVCCIYDDSNDEVDESKFKNKTARKLFEKMKKAKQKEKKKADKDMELSNVISAVSNRHPTINPINIWELTIYQLYDSFSRLQVNEIYDLNSTSISVWGDKERKFDTSLWYKNNYK